MTTRRHPPQLHVGPVMPTEERMKPVINRICFTKPSGGLWTSTYRPRHGSGWVQWCLSEDFGVPDEGWRAWRLQPAENARIYTIASLADLQRLLAEFGEQPRLFPGMMRYPDFEAVAREYDAVHLTDEGQWATRLTHPESLYGWDCESTVWFRWAFDSVAELGVKRFSRSRR